MSYILTVQESTTKVSFTGEGLYLLENAITNAARIIEIDRSIMG